MNILTISEELFWAFLQCCRLWLWNRFSLRSRVRDKFRAVGAPAANNVLGQILVGLVSSLSLGHKSPFGKEVMHSKKPFIRNKNVQIFSFERVLIRRV